MGDRRTREVFRHRAGDPSTGAVRALREWSVVGVWLALTALACTPEHATGCGLDDNGHRGVTVFVGSRYAGPVLRAGRRADCGDGAEAALVLRRATEVAQRLPASLRPATIDIHLIEAGGGAQVEGLEYHRPSGGLLAGAGAGAGTLDDTVWLHEFAHVKMARGLEAEGFARGWREALEEGIADYQAAIITGQPLLGPFGPSQRGRRDLSHAPAVMPGDWESLALPNVAFDPHRLGWSFAAAAFRAEPRGERLLHDLLSCEDDALPSRWLASCPSRSHATITTLLRDWMPAELLR